MSNAKDMVKQEVLLCVTRLVELLMGHEDLEDSTGIGDSAIINGTDQKCALCGTVLASDEEDADSDLRNCGCCEKLVDVTGLGAETAPKDILEWYVVSDYLAEKLKYFGEPLLMDTIIGNLWGRQNAGQALYMDAVIQKIAQQEEEE